MKRAIIVTDLGYGDAGKGSMVDFLARESKMPTLVIRYNGGPQAAHNVITLNGRHHTFAQMGSASFLKDAKTHLSRHMLVNPFNLAVEIEHLESLGVEGLWERLTIDGEAMVITPWHIAANRIRELVRGQGRHGSCGQGIGETRFDSIHFPQEVLRVKDLFDRDLARQKLLWTQNLKEIQLAELLPQLPQIEQSRREVEILISRDLVETCLDFYGDFLRFAQVVYPEHLTELLEKHELALFEGAQGVLLDQDYGFHPYTTWSDTTGKQALDLLHEAEYQGEVTRLGLLRGYMVRHGAGPFVSEDRAITKNLPDYHNQMNDWQHGFRVGHLDLVALKYAIRANGGVDALAVTNLDRMSEVEGWKVVEGYQLPKLHATSPYFTGTTNGVTKEIRVGPKNRRDYQEAITKVLLETKPQFRELCDFRTNGFESYLELIASALQAPVTYTSFGPTAKDKHFIGRP